MSNGRADVSVFDGMSKRFSREEALLRAIGDIDDDLVFEAHEAWATRGKQAMRPPARHTPRTVWFAGVAACLCVAALLVFAALPRDVVVFNEGSLPPAAKVAKPSGVDCREVALDGLLNAYGLAELPNTLLDLHLYEQDVYVIACDVTGAVQGSATVRYAQPVGGTRGLLVSFAPAGQAQSRAELSRLNGVEVVLTRDSSNLDDDGYAYWAEFAVGGTYVRVVAAGLEEAEFIAAVHELVRALA